MPLRNLPGGGASYALLAFDEAGAERRDDPDGADGRLSQRILDQLSADAAVTDVFLFAHGWNGDIADAIDQYDRWIGAMEAQAADKAAMLKRRPNFKPYRIGVHWPSKAWGDETLGAAAAFAGTVDLVADYANRLGDRQGLKERLEIVFQQAARNPDADRLPPAAEQAYREIDQLMVELGAGGEGAAPGSDRAAFDPQACFAAARDLAGPASFGGGGFGGKLLAPLRVLSFWKMKQRGCEVGQTGVNDFLRALQAALAGRATRIHLMGHSFGCILSCAAIAGRPGGAALAPIASLMLAQGAMSLWSMCESIPVSPGQSGYFHALLADRRVAGAIVTTRSPFDTANRVFYPLGAGVAGQVDFAALSLPRYGAMGCFGLQGLAAPAAEVALRAADQDFDFPPGAVTNLEASAVIRNGTGPAGAHNDIAGPEVAHAIWSAAMSA